MLNGMQTKNFKYQPFLHKVYYVFFLDVAGISPICLFIRANYLTLAFC